MQGFGLQTQKFISHAIKFFELKNTVDLNIDLNLYLDLDLDLNIDLCH